ncbi:HAAS signaling domain-containing protein [Solwaraspora sp. WMMB335]|uniref:HAAS signaling domain-containing protein n=1 Tax=Solwaraspora sp. WMMB335 TaxID=3404118 RepID=UPI003B924FAE
MNAATRTEITRYVEQVRAALADLPETVRDELLEDLPEHLAEVLAEGEGTLVERLGQPAAYAAELRSSAAPDAPAVAPGVGHRAAVAWQATRARLGRVDRRVGPVIGYGTASEFLRSLRPAWWVLRGYLAAMVFTYLTTGGPPGLFPRPGGSPPIGLLVLGTAVVGSIWLGRRQAQLSRWPRRTLATATALMVIFGLVAATDLDGRARRSVPGPVYFDHNPYSTIQDIYVYDSQGRLVEGARLFDEHGQPIWLGYPHWCDENGVIDVFEPSPQYVYPFCPDRAPFRLPGSASASPGSDASAAPDPTAPGAVIVPSDVPLTPLTPTPAPS